MLQTEIQSLSMKAVRALACTSCLEVCHLLLGNKESGGQFSQAHYQSPQGGPSQKLTKLFAVQTR